jgi:CheY-like chemotaxis protein
VKPIALTSVTTSLLRRRFHKCCRRLRAFVAIFGIPPICSTYLNGYNLDVAQALKNFLVIEDNPDDALLIRRAFKAADSSAAFISRTLSEAKAHLLRAGMYQDEDRFPPLDAVICDMHLGMDSALDFLKWIKQSDEFRFLPVFVLTGAASTSECGRARDLGALEVLRKPVKYDDLRRMVLDLTAKLLPA